MKYYIYIRIASESLQTLDASKQCQFQLKNFILPWVLHLTGNTSVSFVHQMSTYVTKTEINLYQ